MRLLIVTQVVDRNHSVLGFFHRWIEEFAQHVDYLEVIALEVGEYDLPANVRVHSLGKDEEKGRLAYLQRFYKYIFTLKYDHVFVHMNPEYVMLGGLFWRVMRKKIGLWYTHKHVGVRLRIATFFANTIFTASKESFRLHTEKLHVMGHGIEVSSENLEKSTVHDPVRLITVGRISPVKQYEKMIDVLAKLQEKGVEATLTIVGGSITDIEKEYEATLTKMVKEKNVQNVTFVGPVPHREVRKHLKDADIFLNMSNTGSLDKAVLEAMAEGVIPVTSNEGMESLLQDFFPALYVEKEELLVSTLCTLVNLEDTEWKNLSSSMMEVVKRNHSIKTLISKLVAVYE